MRDDAAARGWDDAEALLDSFLEEAEAEARGALLFYHLGEVCAATARRAARRAARRRGGRGYARVAGKWRRRAEPSVPPHPTPAGRCSVRWLRQACSSPRSRSCCQCCGSRATARHSRTPSASLSRRARRCAR
eukprot:5757977-Prymnesium_polylepis.1